MVLALAGCAAQTGSTYGGSSSMAMSSDARTELANAMRALWADHVIWTRSYIVAAAAGQPDADEVAQRLLANQDQIGQAIVPYYGQAAGDRLAALLRDHILIAVDLVTAAKAGDQADLRDADRRWHLNAEELATFLSGANPNWSRGALLSMLNEHLALTTREATARLQGNFTADIAAFDQIFDQAMMMADALTDGIVKQFPDRFRA
ncbi:MAG: glycosyltransferase [Thermoanaerobaculia bacterium]